MHQRRDARPGRHSAQSRLPQSVRAALTTNRGSAVPQLAQEGRSDDTRPRGWRIRDRPRRHVHRHRRLASPDGRLHTHKVLSRDPHAPGDPAVRGIGEVLARIAARRRRAGLRAARHDRRHERAARAQGRADGAGDDARPSRCAADRLPGTARHLRARDPAAADAVRDGDRGRRAGGRRPARCSSRWTSRPASRRSRPRGRRAYDSVAIVFLHGFRQPAHERHAAAPGDAGRVSTKSSRRTRSPPLLGLVARGDSDRGRRLSVAGAAALRA